METQRRVSAGRIVIYVLSREERTTVDANGAESLPAIVVRPWEGRDKVNLRVFNDGPEDFWRTSVPYGLPMAEGGSFWIWPDEAGTPTS